MRSFSPMFTCASWHLISASPLTVGHPNLRLDSVLVLVSVGVLSPVFHAILPGSICSSGLLVQYLVFVYSRWCDDRAHYILPYYLLLLMPLACFNDNSEAASCKCNVSSKVCYVVRSSQNKNHSSRAHSERKFY